MAAVLMIVFLLIFVGALAFDNAYATRHALPAWGVALEVVLLAACFVGAIFTLVLLVI